jgi:hypothetical protein
VILFGAGLCACGGGSTAAHDAAPADRAATDVAMAADAPAADAPAPDAGLDAPAPGDAGPSCDPESGQLQGGLCRGAFECHCPRVCVAPAPAPAAGACWTACDPTATDATGANPACLPTETCTTDPTGASGCLPTGTLAGDFDVPMFTPPDAPASPADLGAAALVLSGGLFGEIAFGAGYGTTATGPAGAVYRLTFYPGSGATIDWDKPLTLALPADASWAPGATYDFAAGAAGAYHELTRSTAATVTRDVLRARLTAGTLGLTAAATGGRGAVTGTVTGGAVLEIEAEVCGEASVACQ